MIENLNGIRETVNYRKDTRLRLYNNVQIEDYPDHWHTPVEIIMPIENIYSVVVGGHTITLNPTDIILPVLIVTLIAFISAIIIANILAPFFCDKPQASDGDNL